MDHVCLFVRPATQRPDFRLFITFLWEEYHPVDCDGNCDPENPADRAWTRLYVRDRTVKEAQELAQVEIFETARSPLVQEVQSFNPSLAYPAAWFLVAETDGTWSETPDGPWMTAKRLAELIPADFDLDAAVARAEASIWRKASWAVPFPNQE